MKRTAFVIAFLLTAVSCATMQQGSTAHVGRAVQALGGADALAAVKTISTKGTVRQWEPEQSMVAGGRVLAAPFTRKNAGISPQKFAGGHGSVADYAPLAALEGK